MLLFSIVFPVMESATALSNQGSRPQTPTQDEAMETKVYKPLQALNLEVNDEHRSDLVDDSIFDKRGILIQFLNSNCTGSPHVFGGMRLAILDIQKVPAYLTKYRRLIKQHAVKALMKHFSEMQCGAGAAETLGLDDFGMTFTVATVTGHGALLNPGKRQEGPLFFCHFPALVDPVVLTHTDWGTNTEGEAVHVVNCYIMLPPPHARRHLLITKARQDAAAAQAQPINCVVLQSSNDTPAKKPRVSTSAPLPYSRAAQSARRSEQYSTRSPEDDLRLELEALRTQVKNLKGQALPNPPLPEAKKPITWPSKNQCPDLPDE